MNKPRYMLTQESIDALKREEPATDEQLNCDLLHAIRVGYVMEMIRYCNRWGWKHFWVDTFKRGPKK